MLFLVFLDLGGWIVCVTCGLVSMVFITPQSNRFFIGVYLIFFFLGSHLIWFFLGSHLVWFFVGSGMGLYVHIDL